MPEFIVTSPDGREHIVNAPDGATQEQALEYAKSQFGSTQGGAATGNPALRAQGDKAIGLSGNPEPMKEIGAAGLLGGLFGAGGPEILSGAGRVVGALPGGAVAGRVLETTAAGLRNAGRIAPAIVGAQSGALGESAGQVVESMGAPFWAAEAARFAGGAVGPELNTVAAEIVKNKAGIPWVINKFREATGKEIKLSEAQRKYLEQQVAELSGGSTNADLERVGSIMGAEGRRLLSDADKKMADALLTQGNVGGVSGYPSTPTDLSSIGAKIREKIIPQFEAADVAQNKAYKATEKIRDDFVNSRQSAGQFVNQLPEYNALIAELRSELDNSAGKKNSDAVQASIQKIIGSLTNKEKDVFGQAKPIKFDVLDQERRNLGEVFKGKPPEGYAGIEASRARDLYGKIRDIQIAYAGGENGPQAKLLADYAADVPGLQKFTSKIGKKVTALDQYREGVYATDPKDIPAAFFKSKQSFKDLVSLTGDAKIANAAALDYADKQLAGKSADDVRKWLGESEWIGDAPIVRKLVDNYASRLEQSEAALRSATDYAKKVKADANILLKQSLPSKKAYDLVESMMRGETQAIDLIAPVVSKSPQAKKQLLAAVQKVISENAITQTSAKNTQIQFERNLRPTLENIGAADKESLDFISKRLENIAKMQVPEPEKLGMAKRLLLQGVVGWSASTETSGVPWSKAVMVPE